MSLEIFLLLLLIVSIFTGLFTEGIKKLMDEVNKKYLSNFLAGFVAVVLSVLVDAGYIILTEAQINAKMAVYLIALVLLSWLASMVGYDKVIQAITQEVQRGVDMGNVAKIVVGVLAIGGTFFILLIREFGKFIDEVSPYNWGESEVLKDEYKR